MQAEPEGTKNPGTVTKLSDEQDSSEIKGILRGSNTSTGRYYNQVSPFAACDAVSPRNNTGQPSTNGKHFNRASPLAAVEEKSSDPTIKPKSKQVQHIAKRARKVENRWERLQAANELLADQETEAHIANQGFIDICAEIEEVGTTTHEE